MLVVGDCESGEPVPRGVPPELALYQVTAPKAQVADNEVLCPLQMVVQLAETFVGVVTVGFVPPENKANDGIPVL